MDVYENRLKPHKIVLRKNIAHIVFAILLILNNIINMQVYSWLLLGYAAFLMLLYPSEYLLVFCVLTDSIQSYFLVTPTLSYSRIITFMYMISVILRSNGRIRIYKEAIVFAVFGVYHLATAIWSVSGSYAEPISFFIGIAMIILMMSQKLEDAQGFYSLLFFVSAFFVLFIFIQTITLGGLTSSQVVFDEDLNANTICSAVALFSSIIYASSLREEKKSRKLLVYMFMIIGVLTILIVGSRTSLIAYIAVIILLPILTSKKKFLSVNLKSVLGGAIGLAIGIAVLVLLINVNSDIYERFTFAGDSTETLDSRVAIWEALWNYVIPENLWFGIGFGLDNVRQAVAPYVAEVHHAHNMFLAVLSETGIVGFVQYVIVFLMVFKHLRRNPGCGATISMAMLLVGFFSGIGEEVINRKWFWLAVGFAYLLTNSQENKHCTDTED